MDATDPFDPKPKYPDRPKRLPELFEWVNPFYLITFNTDNRLPILARNEVHQTFVRFCRRAEGRQVRVGTYVLMLDHIHLLVSMPNSGLPTLSSWIGSLKNTLGKTLLPLGVNKPHWQENFFDHVIRSAASQRKTEDHMRSTPLRAGLCKEGQKWPYLGEIVAFSRWAPETRYGDTAP